MSGQEFQPFSAREGHDPTMNEYDDTDRLLRALFGSAPENVAGTVMNILVDGPMDPVVADVQDHDDGSVEVWLHTGLRGDELRNIEHLYEVRSIEVYGDPDLAGTDAGGDLDGKLHLHLRPRADL